jgi:hypothetical protein
MKLKKISILIFCIFLVPSFFSVLPVFAQDSLSLTITPPLIKINMDPGGLWSSSIKVVNNNQGELTVYARSMDFKSGEQGGVVFIPREEVKEGQKFLLSQWIEISSGPFIIPAFESKEIPFTIKVAPEAEPGGHYAAILIGTKPPEAEGGVAIKIASQVSSLILLNIQGEIEEKAWIREFSTGKTFYQILEANFKVSFENLGNVHLQPVGEIKIYNMWDKERGTIPINYKSQFGNVLPQSQRIWNFEWKGQEGSFEIGRYKAKIVLSFGQDAHQTASSTVYFWVIPLIPVLGILGGFFIFLILLILGIKSYVKRAVIIAQQELGVVKSSDHKGKTGSFSISQIKLTSKVLRGPINEAIVDLRKVVAGQSKGSKRKNIGKRLWFLIKKYYKFAIFSLIIILWVMAAVFYIQDNLKIKKSFKVIEKKEEISETKEPSSDKESGAGETSSIDEENISTSAEENKNENEKLSLILKVLNGSGIPKIAAKAALLLEDRGFKVGELGNADSFNYQETIIKYKNGREEYAGEINEILGKIGELESTDFQNEDIMIIIGRDFKNTD